MFTVIKLAGCNGSGKTTFARALMARFNLQKAHSGKTKKNPDHYVGATDSGRAFVVLGSYETTCGGMDTISDKLERLALITWACKKYPDGFIFFEGLITGKTYGAIGTLSESHVKTRKGAWLYAFMDSPFSVCVERVLKRCAAAGNANEFDPERTMRPTYDSCVSLCLKVLGTKQAKIGPQPYPHTVHMVRHNVKPAVAVAALLKVAEKL